MSPRKIAPSLREPTNTDVPRPLSMPSGKNPLGKLMRFGKLSGGAAVAGHGARTKARTAMNSTTILRTTNPRWQSSADGLIVAGGRLNGSPGGCAASRRVIERDGVTSHGVDYVGVGGGLPGRPMRSAYARTRKLSRVRALAWAGGRTAEYLVALKQLG